VHGDGHLSLPIFQSSF